MVSRIAGQLFKLWHFVVLAIICIMALFTAYFNQKVEVTVKLVRSEDYAIRRDNVIVVPQGSDATYGDHAVLKMTRWRAWRLGKNATFHLVERSATKNFYGENTGK